MSPEQIEAIRRLYLANDPKAYSWIAPLLDAYEAEHARAENLEYRVAVENTANATMRSLLTQAPMVDKAKLQAISELCETGPYYQIRKILGIPGPEETPPAYQWHNDAAMSHSHVISTAPKYHAINHVHADGAVPHEHQIALVTPAPKRMMRSAARGADRTPHEWCPDCRGEGCVDVTEETL